MPALPSKQAATVQMFYNGVWNDVSSDVFTDEGISVVWGQGDEGAALRPASIGLTFNNAADKYRPSNPMSVLYGVAGRNTPIRVQMSGTTIMTAEGTSFQPGQTIDFKASPARGRRVVDLDAYGVLRRIGQWTDLLGSAQTRFDKTIPNLIGHTPLEDGRDVVYPTNLIAGTSPTIAVLSNFQSSDYPPGSDPLMEVTLGGGFKTSFLQTSSDTTGWQCSWVMRNGNTPGTSWEMMAMRSYSGKLFILNLTGGNTLQLIVGQEDGTPTLINTSTTVLTTTFMQWNLCRLKVSYSAGTTTVDFGYYTLGDTVLNGISGTYSGTPGRLQSASSGNNGWTYGHMLGTDGVATDLLSGNRIGAFEGWSGELVGNRFLRVVRDELGFTCSMQGNVNTTVPMGPQRNVTLPDLLDEMVKTEDGMIFDDRSQIGLVLRTRANRYNQTPLALTFPSQVSAPFEEVLDDLNTHNQVTISNTNGGEYVTTLASGAMSTQAPPAGVGLYAQTIDVNVSDEPTNLPLLAGWWLNRGTLPNSRYPTVTVDLVANPSLVASINAMTIGDMVTVTGFSFDVITLIVIGISQKIGSHTRAAVLTTVPADLFNTGQYDNTSKRYDSASTTTNASQTTTSTSWAIKTTNVGETWSTVSVPYDWFVAGERVTVTAMTAPAGTGPYTQTATVTRSVNGVVKTHASGESIRIATPGRYAL